jgi:predicted N-acyltransferase
MKKEYEEALMPKLKPLKKVVVKVKELRSHHRERHRPTGFGFALAESIDYLDAARWDSLTAQASVFLSRPYLRVLETAGPENVQQRYAMIFRGREAVAALAAQSVTVSAASVPKAAPRKVVAAPLEQLEERLLVCGNLLSWGFHGLAFAPGVDRCELWPAVAEAIYKIRRADRLLGSTDLVMIKDVPDEHAPEAETLKRFSYRQLETEPNMVLELSPAWRSYEDYLASLTSNYRKAARKIVKDVEAADCSVEPLAEIERHGEALHSLYLQVHHRQKLRLVTLSPRFIPSLAAAFGDALRCTVVRRDSQLLGFVTTLRDGDTAVGYYIGFDGAANGEAPIYFRLLQAVIDDAIQLGCRRVSLGRTALEPKARLGARPVPLRIWMRHRIPALNLVVRGLLQTVSHDEAPDRNPFK